MARASPEDSGAEEQLVGRFNVVWTTGSGADILAWLRLYKSGQHSFKTGVRPRFVSHVTVKSGSFRVCSQNQPEHGRVMQPESVVILHDDHFSESELVVVHAEDPPTAVTIQYDTMQYTTIQYNTIQYI